MTEQEQRNAVLVAARTWIGTPYHHHAKVKGAGVDCATLLTESFREAGIKDVKLGYYSQQWHLHRDEALYEDTLRASGCREVNEPKPADIVLYKIGRQFAHGGIVTEVEPLRFIHADLSAKIAFECYEFECGCAHCPRKFFTAW